MTPHYHENESERARTGDLIRALPRGRHSVLDIGARDGYFSRLLTEHFDEVTALDLLQPSFQIPRVTTVAGDVTKLAFPDESFDCAFCTEVLEHVPDVEKACQEIIRVTRHEIIIGVPYRQDTRVDRTTCRSCGKVNPPWGHVNSFDEERLTRLFSGVHIVSKSLVGSSRDATNFLSAFLMDLAGNPWGTYDQDECCIHCGAKLIAPERKLWQKICSAMAVSLNRFQAVWTRPHGNWIHVRFSKTVEGTSRR